MKVLVYTLQVVGQRINEVLSGWIETFALNFGAWGIATIELRPTLFTNVVRRSQFPKTLRGLFDTRAPEYL